MSHLVSFRMATSLILSVAYGLDIQSVDDPTVHLVEEFMANVAAAANPGSFLVDSFPIRMLPRS